MIGATTLTVSARLAPLARLNVLQVITPLAWLPLFVALTNVTPLGSVSTTATSLAVLGPAFDVVITYTSVSPATGLAGLAIVFVMERSAPPPEIVVLTDEVSFAAVGSPTAPVTAALFTTVSAEEASTTTVSVRLAPLARDPTVQVTTPAAWTPPPVVARLSSSNETNSPQEQTTQTLSAATRAGLRTPAGAGDSTQGRPRLPATAGAKLGAQ